METAQTQPSAMEAKPQKEHEWLQKLVGEWTSEGKMPDAPSDSFKGSETVRPLAGLWVVAEARGEMPGGRTVTTIMTLGYDPQRGRFVGTFIGSMMTHLWVYDGKLDESERVLSLDTVGPDFEKEGRMTEYRDVIEFKSDDHRTLTAHMLGEDGQWKEIMSAEYRRA